MSAPDPARKLAALVRRLRGDRPEPAYAPPAGFAEHDPLVLEYIHSFLVWEAGPARADGALRRLLHAVVDYNELRVCLPDELARLLGERYPRALERAARLRAALNDVYRREHSVTFRSLTAMPKRDARVWLDSLEGAPPFVGARMSLLTLGGHAFPVDDRLLDALREEQAVVEDLTLDQAESWLERQFRSGEAAGAYLLLDAWTNERPAKRPSGERAGARRPAGGTRTRRGARPPRSPRQKS